MLHSALNLSKRELLRVRFRRTSSKYAMTSARSVVAGVVDGRGKGVADDVDDGVSDDNEDCGAADGCDEARAGGGGSDDEVDAELPHCLSAVLRVTASSTSAIQIEKRRGLAGQP